MKQAVPPAGCLLSEFRALTRDVMNVVAVPGVHPDKIGEIVEVKGAGGAPPYLVRFDDGHTGLVFPGPDAVVERARRKAGAGRAKKTGR